MKIVNLEFIPKKANAPKDKVLILTGIGYRVELFPGFNILTEKQHDKLKDHPSYQTYTELGALKVKESENEETIEEKPQTRTTKRLPKTIE